MGLRGLHSKPLSTRPQPTNELVITPQALAIFRRMKRLSRQCSCADAIEAAASACPACRETWKLNEKLCECFGLPRWHFAYEEIPYWQPHRSDPSAIDRFHQLERALKAAKGKKEPFRYKWQK